MHLSQMSRRRRRYYGQQTQTRDRRRRRCRNAVAAAAEKRRLELVLPLLQLQSTLLPRLQRLPVCRLLAAAVVFWAAMSR